MTPLIIWTAISNFFKHNKTLSIVIIILLLLLGTGWYIRNLRAEIGALKTEIQVAENNQKALTDTVKIFRTKDGQFAYEKQILIGEIKDIQRMNADLAAGYKRLMDGDSKKNKFISYLETKIKYSDSLVTVLLNEKPLDTSRPQSYIKNDSTLAINEIKAIDNRNYSSLTGDITMSIDSNKIKASKLNLKQEFAIGLDVATYTNDKNELKVRFGTKMPNVNIDVNGATNLEKLLNKKVKKPLLSLRPSIQIGYGYNILDSKLTPAPFIGAGLSLSFNKLFGKP